MVAPNLCPNCAVRVHGRNIRSPHRLVDPPSSSDTSYTDLLTQRICLWIIPCPARRRSAATNNLFSFDAEQLSWRDLSMPGRAVGLPPPRRTSFGVASTGDAFFVLGGIGETLESPSSIGSTTILAAKQT